MRKPTKISKWNGSSSVARVYATLESGKPVVSVYGGTIKDLELIENWIKRAKNWMQDQKCKHKRIDLVRVGSEGTQFVCRNCNRDLPAELGRKIWKNQSQSI